MRSGAQRFYEGPVGSSFPMLFSGVAAVCEWHDDVSRCFRISVEVRNRTWGRLFGYRGAFNVDWRKVDDVELRHRLLPVRTERRE